ncbi:MAG: DUF3048 domain-containing protein [bacterium]|nr:DUF3048 domain-containing protein [bacterium]
MNEKKKILIFQVLAAFGLYLMSAGASYAFFNYSQKPVIVSPISTDPTKASGFRVDISAPKTEVCPINGAKFTKAEKDIWEKRRPIIAMIENHADSRPQSGLSSADIVYEAVAEGGITRFMGVFYCGVAAQEVKIAPVRSVRVYFIDWATEYGDKPIFMHVGGANDFSGYGDTIKEARALEYLETIGWRKNGGNDFDTTRDTGIPVLYRNDSRLDHEVAYEHMMMGSIDAAYAQAEKRGLVDKDKSGTPWDKGYDMWTYVDEKPVSPPSAEKISFGFWSNQPKYDVEWQYEAASNSYLRSNGGEKSIDLETKNQLTSKNIIVLLMKERSSVDRNKHVLYQNVGKGEALVFNNGDVIKGTWEKVKRTDRTIIKDSKGKEIQLTRGKTWIEILPVGNEVSY